jgi:transposase
VSFKGGPYVRTNQEVRPQRIPPTCRELETRPVFHQTDETIRGHVFCSFLALVLRNELDSRMKKAGHSFEWTDIKQDLEALQEVTIEQQNKTLAIRTECLGTGGKIFQSVGVAIPPAIREVS